MTGTSYVLQRRERNDDGSGCHYTYDGDGKRREEVEMEALLVTGAGSEVLDETDLSGM